MISQNHGIDTQSSQLRNTWVLLLPSNDSLNIFRVPSNIQIPSDLCPNIYPLMLKIKHRITKKFGCPSTKVATFHDTMIVSTVRTRHLCKSPWKHTSSPTSCFCKGSFFPPIAIGKSLVTQQLSKVGAAGEYKVLWDASPPLSGFNWESEWGRKPGWGVQGEL